MRVELRSVVLAPVLKEMMDLETDDHAAVGGKSAAARFGAEDRDGAAGVELQMCGQRVEQTARAIPGDGDGPFDGRRARGNDDLPRGVGRKRHVAEIAAGTVDEPGGDGVLLLRDELRRDEAALAIDLDLEPVAARVRNRDRRVRI